VTYKEEYDRLRRMGYPPYEAAITANAKTRHSTTWPETPADRAERKARLKEQRK
jgi:hypothetical protein